MPRLPASFSRKSRRARRLGVERLESRAMLSGATMIVAPKMVSTKAAAVVAPAIVPPEPTITASDVEGLLNRAAAAANTQQAIIAVVDRSGNILGVRVEAQVPIFDQTTMVFAIDGAVSLARTGAFFASGGDRGVASAGPLTSRTVEFISQSTITQREVESSPDLADKNSPYSGPGYVAPIGIGNHFPPGVTNAPQVDLFGIEQNGRTPVLGAGADNLLGTADDTAYNVAAPNLAVAAAAVPSSPSYGVVTGLDATAQSRGIATLPGGIPLYKTDPATKLPFLVGGIGVFFPGPNGYATYEQRFQPVGNPANEVKAENSRLNSDLTLEAEWMAFAAAGGTTVAAPQLKSLLFPVGSLGPNAAPVPGYGLPLGNLNLVGVTLDVYGPMGPVQGMLSLKNTANRVGRGNALEGKSADVSNPNNPLALDAPTKYHSGVKPPDGWLILPHSSSDPGGLTAADVTTIVAQGLAQAATTRAAIRLQIPSLSASATAAYVFAVADREGNILGLYRMPDATIFSIDVAVAKARNTAYFASADLQPSDAIAGVPLGTAFTNRTFRALAEPRFPGGINGAAPGPYSNLLAPGINMQTAEDIGAPLPASSYRQANTPDYMYTSFVVGANFHDPFNTANQNGVVWFPGSSPLYKGGGTILVGGFGVSGDGVDQDDVATVAGQQGFAAPAAMRADQFLVRKVRLPYQKFNRNPNAPFG